MVILFGISWGTLGVIFLLSLLGGAYALENTVSFLLGPAKWIAIAIFILAEILYIYLSLFSDNATNSGGLLSKISACLFNSISNLFRNGINVIFILCVLVGFLQNMNNGGLFNVLFGLFAFLGDGLVLIFALCISITVDAYVIYFSETVPVAVISILNLIVSLFYFFIIQRILGDFYEGTVELLFANNPEITEFILSPWFF